MKNLFTLIFTLSWLVFQGQAQLTVNTMFGNNAQGIFSNDGFLFYDRGNGLPGLEIPTLSSRHSIFASSLWVNATLPNGLLAASGQTYCQGQLYCDFFPGPLSNDGELTTLGLNSEYDDIWVVSRFNVDAHIAYFDCVDDPDCDEEIEYPDGLFLAMDIEDWPGNGPDLPNFDNNLAPYVDRNENGTYDPENGDYPEFCGDYAYFTVMNDSEQEQGESGGLSVGIELRTLVYMYFDNEEALRSTYFVHQEIINRRSLPLADVTLSIWTDIDLGNFNDDYLATHVEKNMVYGYNGDDFDEDTGFGLFGYGEDLAAQGVLLINGPLADADGLDNEMPFGGYDSYARYFSGYSDGEIDNERLGFNSVIAFQADTGLYTSIPENEMEFINSMGGRWRDGSPVFASDFGTGSADPDAVPSRFFFPGDSDPELFSTDGLVPNVNGANTWTEENAENTPGDRKAAANIGSFTIDQGESKMLNYAFVFSRDSYSVDENAQESLIAKIDEVKTYSCNLNSSFPTSVSNVSRPKPLKIYPNPNAGLFRFDLPHNGQYRLLSITGKIIQQGVAKSGLNTLEINDVVAGVYVLQILAGKTTYYQKVIVE